MWLMWLHSPAQKSGRAIALGIHAPVAVVPNWSWSDYCETLLSGRKAYVLLLVGGVSG